MFRRKGQMGGTRDRWAKERTDGQTYRRTEGQTDRRQIGLTKLTFAFCNFANVHVFICMSPTIFPEIERNHRTTNATSSNKMHEL